MTNSGPRGLRLAFGVLAAAFAVHLAHGLAGFGGPTIDTLVDEGPYDLLAVGAAAACTLRVARGGPERGAWLCFALAMWLIATADVLWSLADAGMPQAPGALDAAYLLAYPLAGLGVIRLAAAAGARRRFWLDGLAAALSVTAIALVVVVEPVLDSAHLSAAHTATGVVYPFADAILLALVAAAATALGRDMQVHTALLAAGIAAWAIGDCAYLVMNAHATYAQGGALDSVWPGAQLLVIAAALLPEPARRRTARTPSLLRAVAIPGALATFALSLLVLDHFLRISLGSLILATLAVVVLGVRIASSFRSHTRMLERSRREALVDGLTGLSNRRRLERDLERAIGDASAGRLLVLFDLDGFKAYNDTFGHPAGDALLVRLADRLERAVEHCGRAYRMGGDEFCVLVAPQEGEDVVARATTALTEHGEGFTITASHGTGVIEAGMTPSDALRLADRLMYADKERRRPSVTQEARDVLVTILHETEPALRLHLRDVADLAVAVGRRLGLAGTELDELARAAELHDVGKVAVPDAVLLKPGALDDAELGFIRRHTIVGERILGASPRLRPVATLVRATHERWDGAGYPDGLAGTAIPLGARIIAVCDAYDAMTTERPYRPARDMDLALQELRRGAGAQFDPAVVDAFCAVAGGLRRALSTLREDTASAVPAAA